jgi:hypothetical protein
LWKEDKQITSTRLRLLKETAMKSVVGIRLAYAAVPVWIAQASVASAQWAEQSVRLETGWNAVYLELDPEPSDAEALFEDLPIKAVWTRGDKAQTGAAVNYARDPDDPAYFASTDTGWRVWFPSSEPQHVINSLRVVRGGRAYLIEASAPVTLTIRGRPNASITRWREGYNLEGFHVVEDVASAPTFSQYLQPSEAHQNGAIYEVTPDGTLSRVADPDTARITAGQGYWVQASKGCTYDGPIRIDQHSLRCVDLAPGIAEHRIQVQNLRTTQGELNVTYQPIFGGDDAETPEGTPLLRFDFATKEGSQVQAKWRPLDDVTWPLEAAGQPGSSRTLRVAVSRRDLPSLGLSYGEDGYHHGVLHLTDDTGYMRRLPVRTRDDAQDGLWVGDVTVTDVESLTDPAAGTATASPFTFRVILHKDVSNAYTLLREVVLLWDDGGGSYVLVTPDCLELLDGASVAPRISTANFCFPIDPVDEDEDGSVGLTGDFQTQLTATVILVSDPPHPVDPYRHAAHPEHANGFADGITRALTFVFDGDGGGDPEWGVTRLGGSYQETITGMHKPSQGIQVTGQFEIRKVSDIASLCGQ